MKCRACEKPATQSVHGIRRNVVEQRTFGYTKEYCKTCYDKTKRGAMADADVTIDEMKEII